LQAIQEEDEKASRRQESRAEFFARHRKVARGNNCPAEKSLFTSNGWSAMGGGEGSKPPGNAVKSETTKGQVDLQLSLQ
jgi:hypothetical protein